jgi:hypothetical protein
LETRVSWKLWLAEGRIKCHRPTRQEIGDLRNVVERDLADAAVPGLSADRKFAIAYNAVLQLSRIVVACEGYRVAAAAGHHQLALEAASRALGATARALMEYFDLCRRKRNLIDYDAAEVASQSEADELLNKAREFRLIVEAWIADKHPAFG